MSSSPPNIQHSAPSHLSALLARLTNTIVVSLLWPVTILGFLYLLVFFLLNSSLAPKILKLQLGQILRGDIVVERMETDPFLQQLTLRNVRLSEAGKTEAIIFAPELRAKIPLLELFELASTTTLKLGKITAFNPRVLLDFTQGELTLLKVVLPRLAAPKPVEPPGEFSIFLSDLNVVNGHVRLNFYGFHVDLEGVYVNNFSLRAGQVLSMLSPVAEVGMPPNVRVSSGEVVFDPFLFSFPLASLGDKSEGLVLSGASTLGGKLAYANHQMQRQLENLLRTHADYAPKLGIETDMRGFLHVPLSDVSVDGYRWMGNTFFIPNLVGNVGHGGSIVLRDGMMNIGPTPMELATHAIKHIHKPSGLLPEESILWAADLALDLKVDDPILNYFFGPVLEGQERLALRAQMAGDLARVSGAIALDLVNAESFGVDIDSLRLRAKMDGQSLEILNLEANTHLGAALVTGNYQIMDGDFELKLWSGILPEYDFAFVDTLFAEKLAEGLTPLEFLPDGSIKRLGGLLKAQLVARSNDGELSVSLDEDMSWSFDEALAGIKKIVIKAPSGKDKRLMTMKYGVITSPAGIRIEAGRDFVAVQPGLRVKLNNLEELSANVVLQIQDPAEYLALFGLSDFTSGPLSLSASYDGRGGESHGEVNFYTSAPSIMGVAGKEIAIELMLNRSKLTTKRFDIVTDFGRIAVDLNATLEPASLSDPFKLPFNATVDLQNFDISRLPIQTLTELKLEAKASGRASIHGPIDKLSARLDFSVNDISAFDVSISELKLVGEYENNRVILPYLAAWIEPREARPRPPDFSLTALSYDLKRKTLAFNARLRPLEPKNIAAFRKLNIPLEAKVSFDLSANIDLDILSGITPKIDSTWVEGEIMLEDVVYDGLNLATTQLQMSRSERFVLLKGRVADVFELSGFVRTSPKLGVSLSLNFPDLDILKTLDDIGIDVLDYRKRFELLTAKLGGSVGLCINSLDDISVSLILDALEANVLGDMLRLTQTARIRYNHAKQSLDLRQLELSFKQSVLKLSGSIDAKGQVDLDLNGEIGAAIARSLSPLIKDASGLFGVSLSAHGNYLDQGKISHKNIELSGYLGVRDPIMILTEYVGKPFEIRRGFAVIDGNSERCRAKDLCLYTPEGQPFQIGTDDQWLTLSFLASPRGDLDLTLTGLINASAAQMFVRDLVTAKGNLSLDIHVKGDFLDKQGALVIDPKGFVVDGEIDVHTPISLELQGMTDPIEIDDGIILIADASQCSLGFDCVAIPKERPIRGNVLGGNFIFFGEVGREAIAIKNAELFLAANNISYRLKDELTVSFSPDLQVNVSDFEDFDTFRLSGNVDIADANYSKDFDDGDSNFIKDQILSLFIDSRKRVETYTPSFLRRLPQLGKIRLDVAVSAENSIGVDIKIAGAKLKLELGTQLRIAGNIREILPTGIVAINQGTFTLRENDFEFQQGSQVAFNASMDGKLDISAAAEINTSSNAFSSVLGSSDLDRRRRISTGEATAGGTHYAISLNVGGSLFRPTWHFDSSPYLTDTNIYALIFTGRTIEDFSGNDVAIETLLSPLFSSQLDTFFNADQFKILLSDGGAQFVYIKQINKGLRIAAGVSIKGAEGNEQAVSAEYYFNDNWYIDLTGQNTSDEAGRAPTFKLGARLHWHLPLE